MQNSLNSRTPPAWLMVAAILFSATTARAIRPVDPVFLDEGCQMESGVHASAVSTEIEVVSFSSTVTPGEIPVVCPKGFQAGEQTHTSTGGTCSFRPAPQATPQTKLIFSCKKNTASECSETAGTCNATATVRCVPIPMKTSTLVTTESCRTPGLYGQISALSSALLAGSVMNLGTETLSEIQGGKELPKTSIGTPGSGSGTNATAPEAQQQEAAPEPQRLSFPGRKPPVTAVPAR